MRRNYKHFRAFVKRLTDDVYGQPPDAGHTAWSFDAFQWLATTIYLNKGPGEWDAKILDVGCGQGFMSQVFEAVGMEWTGVTIGEDVKEAKARLKEFGLSVDKVHEADMTFLPFEEEFNLIFARHVLEHSPFPIITLMEWRRVAVRGGHLCLIAPAPHYWKYRGRNHYAMATMDQLKWWCLRAGWRPVHEFVFDSRHALFLKHLEVYQKALETGMGHTKSVLDSYPEGPVEFRLICQADEEVVL